MSDTAQILKNARALVARGWCQGHYAERENGETCDLVSGEAVRWCAEGAIHNATFGAKHWIWREVNDAFCKASDTDHIPSFNDAPGRTQADVLAAFDRAIAAAEKSDA